MDSETTLFQLMKFRKYEFGEIHPKLSEAINKYGINALSVGCGSPLHAASGNGDSGLVLKLISMGADTNLKNYKGDTPLHKAKTKKVAENLIDNGAIISYNNNNESQLHVASENDDFELVEVFIIRAKADTNAKDYEGNTPLHRAKSADVVDILIEHGAHIYAANNRGETSLHIALFEVRENVVVSLLKHGAPISECDKNKRSLLHYLFGIRYDDTVVSDLSSFCWRKRLALELVKYGAEIHSRDGKGLTIRDYAKEKYKPNFEILLRELEGKKLICDSAAY